MDIAYGTKVYDYKKQSIGILICTYNLGFVDAPNEMGAKVVDIKGKSYPTNFYNLTAVDDLTDEEIKKLNIPECFLNN